MDGGELVLTHHALADKNGILVVATFPGHKSHQDVLAQSQFTVIGRRAISEDITFFNLVTFINHRPLVNTGALVRTIVPTQWIDVEATLPRHHDLMTGDTHHLAILFGYHYLA